jgi:N-formylglutamate amidohydrolase
MSSNLPLVLHIPHASTNIPSDVLGQFIVSKQALNKEIKLMTDHFTDWLVEPLNVPTAQQVIAPASRLVVDMERFSDDSQETMSTVGMGAIYKKGSQRQTIRRNLSEVERQHLIETYYDVHHQYLTKQTQYMLEQHGVAIIIDVHSYPKSALPYERDHTQMRPQICIGTCDYHTPKLLAAGLIEQFEDAGFETNLNTPFAGTLIPGKYWQQDKRVIGFMIEVRRDMYMDEANVSLMDTSNTTRNRICRAISAALHQFLAQQPV